MTISPRLSRMLIAAAVALTGAWSAWRAPPTPTYDDPTLFSQGETTSCGIVDTFHGQTVCVYRLTAAQERERKAPGSEAARIIAALWTGRK